MNSIFKKLKTTGQLPTPANIALEILRLYQAENTTLYDLANILEKDPALSGNLLKFANSAGRNMGRPVTSIRKATVQLGMNIVRQLALSFSLLRTYNGGQCKQFNYSQFWSGSLATAVAARLIAMRKNAFDPDEIFACALLSQVGRLALATAYPEDYSRILAKNPDDETLLQEELSGFAINHRELTSEMLKDWGFPDNLITGIVIHEKVDQVRLEDKQIQLFAKQLSLAKHIGQLCVSILPAPEKLQKLDKIVAQYGIPEPIFNGLFDETVKEWQQWGQLFDLPTQKLPPYSEIKADVNAPASVKFDDTASLRVMVVDDDMLTLKLLDNLLTTAHHSVLSAYNGKEALKLALENQPQMLITDWRMPEMDGLQLCRLLRATQFGENIYIIVLTSCETDEELVQAFDAGADDYIVKPVTAKVLEARIRSGQRLIQQQRKIEQDRQIIREYAAQLTIANRRLEQMAMTDVLTQLPNRRYAMQRMQQIWAETDRSESSMSCILIDIDHFKQINDRYGHDCGDYVLQEVAKTLKRAARTNDVVCRIGGEEFLTICSYTPLAACEQLAERLRREVADLQLAFANFNGKITISLGVAARSNEISDYSKLLKNADDALYNAKRSGRNCVKLASLAVS